MEFENSTPARPRPWLLIALGLALVLFVGNWIWSSSPAAPTVATSNQPRTPQQRKGRAAVDPSDLDVRLNALNTTRPGAESVERNPFRFQPKASPPPPPSAAKPPAAVNTDLPPVAQGPPPPPPIPLKFIGIVEKQGLKVAALSDCRSTYHGREGEVIDGRYRLVRIGVESMVIEYTDGRGRTTVRLEGCPAR